MKDKIEVNIRPNDVVMTKNRYNELLKSELKLMYLEDAGVDNWSWYSDAMHSYYKYAIENGLEPED